MYEMDEKDNIPEDAIFIRNVTDQETKPKSWAILALPKRVNFGAISMSLLCTASAGDKHFACSVRVPVF